MPWQAGIQHEVRFNSQELRTSASECSDARCASPISITSTYCGLHRTKHHALCAFGRLYCVLPQREAKSGLQLCSTFHSTVSACTAISRALLPTRSVCCYKTVSCSSVICSADQWCQSAWMRSANGAAALQTPHRFGPLPLRALLLDVGQMANGNNMSRNCGRLLRRTWHQSTPAPRLCCGSRSTPIGSAL